MEHFLNFVFCLKIIEQTLLLMRMPFSVSYLNAFAQSLFLFCLFGLIACLLFVNWCKWSSSYWFSSHSQELWFKNTTNAYNEFSQASKSSHTTHSVLLIYHFLTVNSFHWRNFRDFDVFFINGGPKNSAQPSHCSRFYECFTSPTAFFPFTDRATAFYK